LLATLCQPEDDRQYWTWHKGCQDEVLSAKQLNAFEPACEFLPDEDFILQEPSSFDPLLGTLNPDASACESTKS